MRCQVNTVGHRLFFKTKVHGPKKEEPMTQNRPAQHHAARESFLNCRKCCESSTSNKWLSFQKFFQTTTKSLHQCFSTLRKMVRILLFNENFIRTTNTSSGIRRKFSCGRGSFSGRWWSFLFRFRCLWRHKLTSSSCFQTNVLAKFVDTICVFFYTHSPYFMCHCT